MADNYTETELAYLAGLIDGEGCIGIDKSHKKRGCDIIDEYRLRLRIANTDEAMINWITNIFGGHYEIHESKNVRHKSAYLWVLDGKKAGKLLSLVVKYLTTKKARAELAIRFQNTKIYRGNGRKTLIVPSEVINVRKQMLQTMSELNRRGKQPNDIERKITVLDHRCPSENQSETDLAYMAALIDGEGTIGIHKHSVKRKYEKIKFYELRVRLSNTDENMINWIINKFGGIYHCDTKPNSPQKQIYAWCLYESKAATLLSAIKKYLITKSARAELALKFQNTKGYRGRTYISYIGNVEKKEKNLPLHIVKEREQLYGAMRILNKRGIDCSENSVRVCGPIGY